MEQGETKEEVPPKRKRNKREEKIPISAQSISGALIHRIEENEQKYVDEWNAYRIFFPEPLDEYSRAINAEGKKMAEMALAEERKAEPHFLTAAFDTLEQNLMAIYSALYNRLGGWGWEPEDKKLRSSAEQTLFECRRGIKWFTTGIWIEYIPPAERSIEGIPTLVGHTLAWKIYSSAWNQPILPTCDNDCKSDATLQCKECNVPLCIRCDLLLHKGSKTKLHTRTHAEPLPFGNSSIRPIVLDWIHTMQLCLNKIAATMVCFLSDRYTSAGMADLLRPLRALIIESPNATSHAGVMSLAIIRILASHPHFDLHEMSHHILWMLTVPRESLLSFQWK